MSQKLNQDTVIAPIGDDISESAGITIFDSAPTKNDSKNESTSFNVSSPACTSIALFRPSRVQPTVTINEFTQKKTQTNENENYETNCFICSTTFVCSSAAAIEERKNVGAIPKMLPCGHSFCAECIFSLCLHKEYYLLENVFCLKCGNPCEARQALKAPTDFRLIECLNENRNDKNNTNDNITVVYLTNRSSKSNRKKSIFNNNSSSHPIANNDLSTPKRYVRNRNATVFEAGRQIGKNSTDLEEDVNFRNIDDANVQMVNATRTAFREKDHNIHNSDYGSDSCGTSQLYEASGEIYERISPQPQPQSTEQMESNCAALCDDNKNCANDWRCRAKFTKLTQKFNSQLSKARFRARSFHDENYRATSDSVTIKCSSFSVRDETTTTKKSQHQSHFQLYYINILNAFDDASRILRLEFATKADCILIRRLDTLRKCLMRCRFDFEAQRVMAYPMSTDEICACAETILALIAYADQTAKFFQPNDIATPAYYALDRDRRLVALEQLTREMRAFDVFVEKSLLRRALINAARLLTSLLSEKNPVETIPFFNLCFRHIFTLLKKIVNVGKIDDSNDVTIRKTQLWKMAQTAFSELMRVAGTHWRCSNVHRIALVSSTAAMCSLFAEVCDTATILLCIIEAARARVALSEETLGDDISIINSSAEFYLQKIDENLMECRRIQKLTELRTQTRFQKRNRRASRDNSTASGGESTPTTPLLTRKRCAPFSDKNASSEENMPRRPRKIDAVRVDNFTGKNSLKSDPALPIHNTSTRQRFSWRRLFPLRIFGAQ